MDSLIPLLLMLLIYLVPELLKRRKQPKEYKYPDIPDKVPAPVDMKPKPVEIKAKPVAKPAVNVTTHAPKDWEVPQKTTLAMPPPVTVPHSTEPVSPWQGKLSPQIVQNGLIFAEIIQPPRAYRPIWRKPK